MPSSSRLSSKSGPPQRALWQKLKGDGTSFGASSSLLRQTNEFLQAHSVSELLPYRSFDPETQLFLNRSSLGFVIETIPLVGCGEEIPRQLTGLFQHSLPLGSSLQCLLIASARIEERVNVWEETRRERGVSSERTPPFNGSSLNEVIEALSKERGAYMRKLGRGFGVRTFRLILSYSEPASCFESIDSILSLREQILTTLKGWGLPTKVWQAEDLIRGLDELLNPSDRLDTLEVSWNEHDSLSHSTLR